ncbi:hypothetical protein PVAP13_7KG024977 [Panicum virgatum]|uniref:Uncharacterized protein n=1 Tax=Panicum virgatum TaxID=38727 RepID=A0A8T0QC71_PANVG|nr:hypothetical protein PVAP13_7KG024977 [Panicum virgatum]
MPPAAGNKAKQGPRCSTPACDAPPRWPPSPPCSTPPPRGHPPARIPQARGPPPPLQRHWGPPLRCWGASPPLRLGGPLLSCSSLICMI